MTVAPGEDDGSSHQEEDRQPASAANPVPAGAAGGSGGAGGGGSWRSAASDDDVDAAFAAIVSGIMIESAERHPSAGPPVAEQRPAETGEERARRRELRRLERAEEVAAFAAEQAEVAAERDADEAHFTPPEPPPLPRPKGRTIGALLMLVAGIALMVRPGMLAVGVELTLVIAVVLILGGAVLLLTGIWKRRSGGDGWDDGAIV